MTSEEPPCGCSKEEKLDIIVWVDPQKYYDYPYAKKPDVANMIGMINQYFSQQGKHMMLLVPGRCGTSSPELSVPVKYSDVSCFSAICEVAYSKAGYNPSLSYGQPHVPGAGGSGHLLRGHQ